MSQRNYSPDNKRRMLTVFNSKFHRPVIIILPKIDTRSKPIIIILTFNQVIVSINGLDTDFLCTTMKAYDKIGTIRIIHS